MNQKMAKIKVKKRKPTKVAYVEYTGEYSTIPFDEAISKLYAYAKSKKLRPGFKPFAIYLDDPHKGDWNTIRTQVAISINKLGEPTETVSVTELPQMEVATMKFTGCSEEYQQAYDELGKWIAEQGYKMAGPPLEIWGKKPKVVNGKSIINSEIQFPIIKT